MFKSKVAFVDTPDMEYVERFLNKLDLMYEEWQSENEIEFRLYVNNIKNTKRYEKLCKEFEVDLSDCEYIIFYEN